jgi:hypothetical protein
MNAKIATTVLTAEVTLVVVIDVIVKEANADSMTVVVTVEVTTVVEEMTVGLMAEAVEIPIKMVVTGFVHVVKMTILPAAQFVIVVKQSVQKEWAAMVETAVAATDAIVEEVIVDSMTVVETEEVATVEETEEVATVEETEVAEIPMTETGFVLVVKMTILPEGQNVTGAKPHAQAAVQVEVATAEVATVVEVEISETGVETEVAIAEVATVVEVEISETGVETEVESAEIAETKMAVEIPM